MNPLKQKGVIIVQYPKLNSNPFVVLNCDDWNWKAKFLFLK